MEEKEDLLDEAGDTKKEKEELLGDNLESVLTTVC